MRVHLLFRFHACYDCVGKFLTSVQVYIEAFVDHNAFQRFILFCILINTFSMGIEYHDQPDWLTKTVEISNLVFSIIFAIEMVLKLLVMTSYFHFLSLDECV